MDSRKRRHYCSDPEALTFALGISNIAIDNAANADDNDGNEDGKYRKNRSIANIRRDSFEKGNERHLQG